MTTLTTDPAPPEAPIECDLCPRLAEFRAENKKTYPDYFNGAVPSFTTPGGTEAVKLLIVGLAPGLHGANKTGRPFTGDFAGDLLYKTLTHFGLANDQYDAHKDDGFALERCMVTNAVRCVPPQNKPTGGEATACRPFLVSRIASLPALKAIVCLGKISHDNTLRALGQRLSAYPFGHNVHYTVDGPNGPLSLVSSYHCSRYNTNTGRLTEPMFHDVFARIVDLID